jgi:hypothetical protein
MEVACGKASPSLHWRFSQEACTVVNGRVQIQGGTMTDTGASDLQSGPSQIEGVLMSKIVPQLIEMAMDPSFSTTDLLRRALVVASRTGANELVSWINSELKGYGAAEVPAYRHIRGELKVFNPRNGPIPVVGLPADLDGLRDHELHQSVAELELLANSDGPLTSHFQSEQEAAVMGLFEVKLRPLLQFAPVQLIGVIQHVRGEILEWALGLERKGVLGDGSTFSEAEKSIVQNTNYTFNNTSGQIQIHSNESSQVQTTGIDSAALWKLIEVLQAGLDRKDVPKGDVAELQAELATLKAQTGSPKPKIPIIRAALLSVKGVLENAAGSLLATQAQPYVTALLAAAA